MECPLEELGGLNVALPLPFSVIVPRVFVPSLKMTVPLGMPAPGAAAVTVTVIVLFLLLASDVVVLALFTC